MFRIAFQKSPLLALFFFTFGDVLSENFLMGAEDQLAVESNHFQISEITDIPNYSQKALKGLQDDRTHKVKSVQAKEGRNWKNEKQNRNLNKAKNGMNCSSNLHFRSLEYATNCLNLNKKEGYEIYSFVDDKGVKKVLDDVNEEKYNVDPQRLYGENRNRLSSNSYLRPLNLLGKPKVLRNQQNLLPSPNPKTALDSQSVTVHVLPPDSNYSANMLYPQGKLPYNNGNEISSYSNYNLPFPIFRNVMDKNGQLTQQFIVAKPIQHKTLHLQEHDPIMTRTKQSQKEPDYSAIVQGQQQHQMKHDFHIVPKTNPKFKDTSTQKLSKSTHSNKNSIGSKLHSTEDDNYNTHKIQRSPQSSYSKISLNPSKYQNSPKSGNEKDSKFSKIQPKSQNHHNFRKGEKNYDSHNSHKDHVNRSPEHQQINYNFQNKEPITRGKDHSDSEEDTESNRLPHYSEQGHPTDEDNSHSQSQEINDYDDDTLNDNEHEHQRAQEGSSPTYQQSRKYDDNDNAHNEEKHSSQEIGNSHYDPNSNEDTSHFNQNSNNRQHESSNRVPKRHNDLNKFFYGHENDDDEDEIRYVNLVDKEEIEKDKNEYHKMKHEESDLLPQIPHKNSHKSKYNHNVPNTNVGNHLHFNGDKNRYTEPHHGNNYKVNHNNRYKEENLKHNNDPYNQDKYISRQNNNIHGSNGQHIGYNQQQLPTTKDNNGVHYVTYKATHQPQNEIYPIPQLYQLNGVAGNSIPIHENKMPLQYLHLPNSQIINAKSNTISNQIIPNSGSYRNDEKVIPHHILLKHTNIPLTFHHIPVTPWHSYSDKRIPNIVHGSNHNYDRKRNKHVNNLGKDDVTYQSKTLVKNRSHPSQTQISDKYNEGSLIYEDNKPNHYNRNNIKYEEEPSSSEVDTPHQGKKNDRKYKEESNDNEDERPLPFHNNSNDGESSNEEDNLNHPHEDDERYNEEESSSTEEDSQNNHVQDNNGRHRNKEAASYEVARPHHQQYNNNNRFSNNDASSKEEEDTNKNDDSERFNNDNDSSNEEETHNHQENNNIERHNDDESSSHEIEKPNRHDIDDESASNDVVVEDEGDEEVPDKESSDNKYDRQPKNYGTNDGSYDQKMISSEVPKHENSNPYEEGIESNEQLSQDEKKNLFERHFENEFRQHPSSFKKNSGLPTSSYPTMNHPPQKLRQNLYKIKPESSRILPHSDEDFSIDRRSFTNNDENQQQDTQNLNAATEVPNSPSKSFTQVSKIKIPQFESFGNFFLN